MIESNGKIDMKIAGLVLSLVAAFAAPFIAVGGFREKVSQLVKTAEEQEAKINTIITTENQKDVQIEGRLARIETLLVDIKQQAHN